MRLRDTDLCWCKSKVLYGQCHKEFDRKLARMAKLKKRIPTGNMIRNCEQIEGIREAGRINTMVLDYITPFVKEGVSTEDLNQKVDAYTRSLGGIPAPLNYEGYPKSVCISLNDVVCHGIPDEKLVLQSGDIVNIDCTTIYNGYYGDASRMFCIGEVDPMCQKLVEDTKTALELGVKAAKPWGHLGDVGFAINKYAQKKGYSVVREIGGHGVGLKFHEDPWVSHIGGKGTGMILVPGMTFTIEPMINLGAAPTYQDEEDGWTVYTEDGSPSAQWEYMLLMTEDGPEILSY